MPRRNAPARTGRLVALHDASPHDRAEFTALRIASRAHLEPWEPPRGPSHEPFTTADFDAFLATADTPASRRFLIVSLADDRLVGQVSLSQIIRGPLCQCFIGYWLGHHATGRGFMTEAVILATAHAFDSLALHRVELNCQPANAPSRRVAQRAGYRLEGFSPRYLAMPTGWADHERWAITAEEWAALHPPADPLR